MEAQRRRASGKTVLGKALQYALGRWEALTRYADDGRLAIDNNVAERLMRGIATIRSLYPSFSNGCKHWEFVLLPATTRAGSPPDGGPNLVGLQVRRPDLVGCARHDLFGGQQLVTD